MQCRGVQRSSEAVFFCRDGQIAGVDRAKRYLAYFQTYTSTYAEVQLLDCLYRQALSHTHIAGLCVGTRPDCVPASVLALLAGYRDRGV